MTEQEKQKLMKTQILKAQAVRQAIFEIVGEQRAEIVQRARAKLVAMGIEFAEEDMPTTPEPQAPHQAP